jgi:hypothetical protein
MSTEDFQIVCLGDPIAVPGGTRALLIEILAGFELYIHGCTALSHFKPDSIGSPLLCHWRGVLNLISENCVVSSALTS